jgi:ribonuclease D
MRVVEGECRRLELISPPENAFDPADFVRIKGAAKLDKQSQRALAELFVARDRLAREHDVPPFKVLNNDVLLRIARERPRNGRELADLISPRQARRVEREVLEALARARELGPLERLPAGRRDGEPLGELEFDVHEALKEWRKRRAVAEGYDASLVLNRHVLLRLARTRPGTAEELAAVDGLLDWQAERFGDELLAAIGKAVATFEREGPSRIRRRRSRRGP